MRNLQESVVLATLASARDAMVLHATNVAWRLGSAYRVLGMQTGFAMLEASVVKRSNVINSTPERRSPGHRT